MISAWTCVGQRSLMRAMNVGRTTLASRARLIKSFSLRSVADLGNDSVNKEEKFLSQSERRLFFAHLDR